MTLAAVIEKLNAWGDQLTLLAWPVFWQSSILIAAMFVLDFFLRRKLRPAIRHALWLVVLVKLVLPPAFAFPTGISWWLRPREIAPSKPAPVSYVVTYGPTHATVPVPTASPALVPPPPIRLSTGAWMLLGTSVASLSLLVLMWVRWRRLRKELRTGQEGPMWLQEIVSSGCQQLQRSKNPQQHHERYQTKNPKGIPPQSPGFRANNPKEIPPQSPGSRVNNPEGIAPSSPGLPSLRGYPGFAVMGVHSPEWVASDVRHSSVHARVCHHRRIRIMLTSASISPVLYGLFRPIIVLPATLVERLTPSQLRAVVLHELIHLRNGDVWINCFQSLLQIVFWWHPLLWFANARIRRIREEVVDDAVRLALGDQAESYAPTLLEVARLALARPLATLGLVGILESRHALRQRVERMLSSPVPKRTGLTLGSVIGVLAFSSVAVPMGQAPPKPVKATRNNSSVKISVQTDHTGPAAIRRYRNEQFVAEQKLELSAGENLFTFPQTLPDPDFYNYQFTGQKAVYTASNGTLELTGNPIWRTVRVDTPGEPLAQNNRDSDAPGKVVASQWQLQLLDENGWSNFDVRSRVATAGNGAKLTYKNTSITADNITLNQESGDLVAEGSVKLEGPVILPLGGKFHGNITNLQFAQNHAAAKPVAARQASATGRKAILNKLQAITLNNVTFDNLPLSEVVNYLQTEARKRDPEGKGINFIINANLDMPAPAIDPATGLPISPTPPEPVDINGVTIRILPALNDVRMIDVLDAVVKVANARIRYSIEDYGVSIRAGGPPVPLFTRTIKVDPNTFAQGLESVAGVSVGNFQTGQGGGGQQGNGVTFPRVQAAPNGGGGQGAQAGQGAQGGGGISGVTRPTTAITPQAIHQFFANAGVDLTPPKSIFYNHGSSSLMVHATKEDLDTIENAIKAIPTTSAQSATTKKIDTTPTSNAEQTNVRKVPVFGGDVPVLGKALTHTVEVSSATSPVAQKDKVSRNPNAKLSTLSVPPPQINIKARFVEIAKGDTQYFLSLLNQLRIQFPGDVALMNKHSNPDASFAEAMTDSQFRALFAEAKQRNGADILTTASVTTLSGRQAQIQMVDMTTVPLKINPQALVSPGVTSSNVLITENLAIGPVLDVIPVVSDDGLTISLNVTATVTGLVGYDELTKGEEVQAFVDGKVQSVRPPLPHIRMRQVQMNETVRDGQTLMLHSPTDVTIAYDKEGNTTRQQGTEPKDLLVFVTTTIIDAAGNPVHGAAAPNQK